MKNYTDKLFFNNEITYMRINFYAYLILPTINKLLDILYVYYEGVEDMLVKCLNLYW